MFRRWTGCAAQLPMAADDPIQISHLFHEALRLNPGARAAYLARVCGGDDALRHEVESLLAQDGDVLLVDGVAAMAAPLLRGTASTMTGRMIGSYAIGAPIGAGGMGEVYRARDTKLGRDVAVKILPRVLSTDPERLGRFEQEARMLASLNHPHIAAIYEIETYDGAPALVLELVEGGTLADRLQRGPIPAPEALRIARQIADALEAAHEKNIVHRDLKPSNVALTRDGTVKVLDFGLAKALDPTASSGANVMNSPALTKGTVPGVILGTAAYMSPEQAAGKAVDKRSDLWAFGTVLMEMLTGRPVFAGETASHVLAAVLAKDPDWTMLPPVTPVPIRTLLRRCLEKDRKRRIADAADVRLEIDDALATSPGDANTSNPARSANRWSHFGLGVIVAALVIAGMLAWRGADRGQPTPVYASLDAPADYVLGEDDYIASLPTRTPMVFTSDGRSLIIQAARAGKPQLFLRSLDRPDARPIAGTDDARVPFVSPDGKWVGFWAANELRKVPIEGGTPTTICRLPSRAALGPIGATWSARDVIVFSDPASGHIMRVSAGGGTPTPATAAPRLRHLHVAPFFLPDAKRFLFSDVSVLDTGDARLMVQALDGGDARVVVSAATDGRLLPSGRLAFMRLGTLMTAGFDLARAEVTSDPVAALGGVMQSGLRARAGATNTGAGMFAVSSLGALAVVRGPLTGGEEGHLTWVTPDGRSSSAEPASGAPAGARLYTRISPDRSRAIVTVITPTRFEHWFADWKRDVWIACGDCSSESLSPLLWSPDGRRLLLPRNDTLVAHALDGSAPDQAMVREADRRLQPAAWLADGGIVYTSAYTLTPGVEIKLLDVGTREGRVIVPLGMGNQPDVTPDGRWLAYTSTQTDQGNVVVQRLAGPGSRTPVSSGGGQDPVWSADGRTLYYLKFVSDPPGTVAFAVDIAATGGALAVGTPRELFRSSDPQTCNPRCYDVSNGPRFLLSERSKHASVTRMDLVLNWTSTLPKGR
jgi:serine/threonine protein kinase